MVPDRLPDHKSRYPYNWEVLSALFFMPFADDFLVAFPKLVAWALFGLSVYRLSIQVGARRAHALASALLVLTMPLVLWHVNTMLVDVPLAALFTACLSLSVSYARTRAPSELALFVAALGVLAGIKPSALPYVAVLLGSLAVLVRTSVFLREPTAPASPRAPAVVLGAGAAAGFLLAGCFWYVRNVVEIGNPIGFVRVRVFGVTLLSSAVDLIDWADMRRTSLAHLFEVRNLEHWKVLLDQLALQLGPSFFVLVVASLPLLAAAGAPERGIRRERRLWLAALLVATGLLYWSTPYNTDVGDYRFRVTGMAVGGGFRFGLPFVGVLAVAAAAGATVLRARDASLVALALLGAAAGLLGAGMLGLGVGLVACAVLGLTWTRLPTRIGGLAWDLSPARRAVAVLLALAVLTAGTLLLRQERTAQRRVAYGGLLEYMAANLGRAEVVGYLLSDRSYLFYGENWRQKVVYVPATSPSLTGWLEALAAKGVGVVAIGPVQDEWRSFGEPAWLEQADGPFVSVFGRDPRREPVLYRIKPGRRPAPPG